MENLSQIPKVCEKIKLSSRATIVALHKLVFENDGDRSNRQRLREFKGFTFKLESPEFNAKMEYAGRLSLGELISICNILGLEYAGNKEDLRVRIIKSLMNLDSLVVENDESSDNDDGEENNDDENNDDENNDENEENNDGENEKN